jgi:hypothetical protein
VIRPASDPFIQQQGARAEAKTYTSRMTTYEWGSKRTVTTHTNKSVGYSKYFPNQKRIDLDLETGGKFDVTINSKGFRGRDYTDEKKPGAIRIVTLGASSTFGYYNRDSETYPASLEEILNDNYPGEKHFEVINLGIPHLSAESIHALFVAEGIALNPDVVTFYEGNNDAYNIVRRMRGDPGFFSKCVFKVGEYSIVVGYMNSILNFRKGKYSYAEFQKQTVSTSNGFINSVSKIHQQCKQRGILFLIANQQKNSQTHDREKLKELTYEEEVSDIQTKLIEGEYMKPNELRLLLHATLMMDLAKWAEAEQVPFVDVIARLDQDRDVLVSWVHLSPRGNYMVAEAFAEEILRHH